MRWRGLFIIAILLVAEVAQAFSEPLVQEIQRAALDYHGLNPHEVRSWQKSARRAPWLPRFQVGYDRNVDSKIAISVDDNASVTSKGIVVGPKLSRTDANSQDQDAYEIRAVWSLDELIYNRNQIDLNEEMRQVMREGERIAREVNRIYHDRIEARRRHQTSEAARLEGDLDAMTGGWFTEECRRRGS